MTHSSRAVICLLAALPQASWALAVLLMSCSGGVEAPPIESRYATVRSADDALAIGSKNCVRFHGVDVKVVKEVISNRQLERIEFRWIEFNGGPYPEWSAAKLTILGISGCEGLGAAEGRWLATAPALRFLDVIDSDVSSDFWAELSRSASIRHLRILGRRCATEADWHQVASIAGLSSLDLDGVDLDTHFAAAFAKAVALEQLTAARCTISPGVDVSFVDSMPKLTKAEFVYCELEGEDAFRPLLGKRSLEYVNFSGTKKVSSQFIEELRASIPDARIFGPR